MGLCKLCEKEPEYKAPMPKVDYSLGNSSNNYIANYSAQNLDYSNVLGGYKIR